MEQARYHSPRHGPVGQLGRLPWLDIYVIIRSIYLNLVLFNFLNVPEYLDTHMKRFSNIFMLTLERQGTL